MLVSILHRVTGAGLTIVGLGVLAWWLVAISGGDAAYASFVEAATHPAGRVVLIGLTWAFFQHMVSGMRHLIMDTGTGFEIKANKTGAVLTILIAVALTAAVWAKLLGAIA